MTLDDGAELVKVPLIHRHREVVTVAALKDVNTQLGEMVLMGSLAPAAWLHPVCSAPNMQIKIVQIVQDTQGKHGQNALDLRLCAGLAVLLS